MQKLSVFQQLWLVICSLIPPAPQKPLEAAPASSPASATQSPSASSIESAPRSSPDPTSRSGISGDRIIPVKTAQAASVKSEGLPAIVAFGDSLTAGYGLTEDQRFTTLLQRKINEMVYRRRKADDR